MNQDKSAIRESCLLENPQIGLPLSQRPDRLAYLENGGPQKPYQVVYVEMFEHDRSGGILTWIVFAFLFGCVALFGAIGVQNLIASQYFSLGISVAISVGLFASAFRVGLRLWRNHEDKCLRDCDDFRIGLYLDSDLLILRFSNSYSSFPRGFVQGVRTHSKYNSETKQTVKHLVLSYQTELGGTQEIWMDYTFGNQQGSIVRLVHRWLDGKC